MAVLAGERPQILLPDFITFDIVANQHIRFFIGKLAGYARVEVEFKDEEEMGKFIPPEW